MSDQNETVASVVIDIETLRSVAGELEEFGVVDNDTISCRYADCCIRRTVNGWEYCGNRQYYDTPTDAWVRRRQSSR